MNGGVGQWRDEPLDEQAGHRVIVKCAAAPSLGGGDATPRWRDKLIHASSPPPRRFHLCLLRMRNGREEGT